MPTKNRTLRFYLFVLRQARWVRYALYLFVPVLLLTCGLFTFSLSIKQPDSVVQSLLLNISAGFIGSFFTFIIIGLFEFARTRISFFELSTPHLTRILDVSEASLEHFINIDMFVKQISRLEKIIDFENSPVQSLEILRSERQLANQAVKELKDALNIAEDRIEALEILLEQALPLKDKQLFNTLHELNKSSRKERDDIKLLLDTYIKMLTSLAKREIQADKSTE